VAGDGRRGQRPVDRTDIHAPSSPEAPLLGGGRPRSGGRQSVHACEFSKTPTQRIRGLGDLPGGARWVPERSGDTGYGPVRSGTPGPLASTDGEHKRTVRDERRPSDTFDSMFDTPTDQKVRGSNPFGRTSG
jgi:hypothetical protein